MATRTPTGKGIVSRGFLAFDTEDDSNGSVTMINFYDGMTHTTFYGPDLQWQAWNWLNAQAPVMVWACNMEYDLVNLCGPWVGKMATLVYRGSTGMIRASWRDAKVRFFDTLRHWPMSVEQMGRFIGLPKLDRLGAAGSLKKEIEYCQRDTEITWKFVYEMLRRYDEMQLDLRETLPGMALQLFKNQFYLDPWPTVTRMDKEFFRQGYYGGRVEVYHFGLLRGPIHHYDVNSLFPSVMKEKQYPDIDGGPRYTSSPDFSNEGMAEVDIVVPQSTYPSLPSRGYGELVYAWGALNGTWTYPELRAAIQRGAKITRVYSAIEYGPMRHGEPFGKYVDYCYGRRLKGTHDLDKVFWKLMMNSLYGKFGQSEGGVRMIVQDVEKTQERPAPHANVLWAAYVTSHARVRLLEFLEETSECFYTDTDSLFTRDELPTSMKLGKLKWEGTAGYTQFYGNKLYVLTDYAAECGQCKGSKRVDGTTCTKCRGTGQTLKPEIIKAKGIPPDAASDFIRTGHSVYRKPIRYRESRRGYLDANVWLLEQKRRDDLYSKRVVLADGSTWPWRFDKYREAVISGETRDPKLGRGGMARTKSFDLKPRRSQ